MTLLTLAVWYGICVISSHMTVGTLRYAVVRSICQYGGLDKCCIMAVTGGTVLTVIMALAIRGCSICLVVQCQAVAGITHILFIGRSIRE